MSPVNWLAFALSVTTVLFYVGLGVLGGEKKDENGCFLNKRDCRETRDKIKKGVVA